MRSCTALAIASLIGIVVGQWGGAITPAKAAGSFPCDAFTKNADGSWTAQTTTLIPDRNFRVQEGSVWRPGATVLGMDVASTLDQTCPNAVATAPVSPQPVSQVPLAQYADANGNIDARSLTCGHLDDVSPEDALLLLAWYSGWYGGSAKARSVNLPRVRYASRSVIDFCKANPEKNLAQVFELMLK